MCHPFSRLERDERIRTDFIAASSFILSLFFWISSMQETLTRRDSLHDKSIKPCQRNTRDESQQRIRYKSACHRHLKRVYYKTAPPSLQADTIRCESCSVNRPKSLQRNTKLIVRACGDSRKSTSLSNRFKVVLLRRRNRVSVQTSLSLLENRIRRSAETRLVFSFFWDRASLVSGECPEKGENDANVDEVCGTQSARIPRYIRLSALLPFHLSGSRLDTNTFRLL